MSVQPYLRTVAAQGRETVVSGPFEAFFNSDSAGEGSNYAIPADGARPTPADVDALAALFRARRRRPRLEFLRETAPAAEAALLGGGFEAELRTPMLVQDAPATTLPEPDPALTLHVLGADADDADLVALLEVQARAFGDEPDPARVAWIRRARGRWGIVLARLDGEPAGGGMSLDVRAATTELVGIATAERFRRRGVAAAVTAELAALARDAGATTVFLTPGDDGAQRVYERAGFRAGGATMLHLRAA